MTVVAALYYFEIISIKIPWLAVSVIGAAVAFYVGFKNNQAYDRLWEARKIWGGIVNESRSWGMMVDGFVSDQFNQTISKEELHKIKRRLIYRHIAWLYAHRAQLLVPTSWEHITQGGHYGKLADKYQRNFGVGLIDDDDERSSLDHFLGPNEAEKVKNAVNTATQLINEQSRDLRALRKQELIDDFRHMRMVDVLRSFYTLQGKNERIKKFPFPRQYANMSRYFIGIFIILLPFSAIPEMLSLGTLGLFLSILITVLISWVDIVMELIGDYSENPFSSMINDIPMLSLCRTIEIDLREILGEKDLPPAIKANRGVLM